VKIWQPKATPLWLPTHRRAKPPVEALSPFARGYFNPSNLDCCTPPVACGDEFCLGGNRPATITVEVAVTDGSLLCTVGSDYPDPAPCGRWVGGPNCDPCTCGNGTYVLDATSLPNDDTQDCAYSYTDSGYTNCCSGSGVPSHYLVITVKFLATVGGSGETITATYKAGGGGGHGTSNYYSTETVSDCSNFSVELSPDTSSDYCPGTLTVSA